MELSFFSYSTLILLAFSSVPDSTEPKKNLFIKYLSPELRLSLLHVFTHVVQNLVPLQLCVSDLVLQHHQLLFVLLLQRVQTPLAVLQLVYELLFDRDLTGDVGQVCLDVFCTR